MNFGLTSEQEMIIDSVKSFSCRTDKAKINRKWTLCMQYA